MTYIMYRSVLNVYEGFFRSLNYALNQNLRPCNSGCASPLLYLHRQVHQTNLHAYILISRNTSYKQYGLLQLCTFFSFKLTMLRIILKNLYTCTFTELELVNCCNIYYCTPYNNNNNSIHDILYRCTYLNNIILMHDTLWGSTQYIILLFLLIIILCTIIIMYYA